MHSWRRSVSFSSISCFMFHFRVFLIWELTSPLPSEMNLGNTDPIKLSKNRSGRWSILLGRWCLYAQPLGQCDAQILLEGQCKLLFETRSNDCTLFRAIFGRLLAIGSHQVIQLGFEIDACEIDRLPERSGLLAKMRTKGNTSPIRHLIFRNMT